MERFEGAQYDHIRRTFGILSRKSLGRGDERSGQSLVSGEERRSKPDHHGRRKGATGLTIDKIKEMMKKVIQNLIQITEFFFLLKNHVVWC